MKRTLITIALILGLLPILSAHPVDEATAHNIASKFMGTNDIQLSKTYQTDQNSPALFIFNTKNGFVIVAADDCETPIIGYSHEGSFDPNDIPVQMEEYLQDFANRIQYGIEHQAVADEITARQWALAQATGRLNSHKEAKSAEPLITTKWHQGCLYNSLCPLIETQPCGHAETGCVAVAMAQIMNYWKFPEVGYGSHSYPSSHGTLSANFAGTTYQWEQMPDSLTNESSEEQVNAVATLLYHCGVSVDMYYSSNGSGAHSADIPNALIRYFKYSRRISRETKGSDNALWLAKLKASIDALQPVLYSGSGSIGHAFICDGYDDNDLLHFNWGWGGNCDGYFALGNLNPQGNSYNQYNVAIFNITPDTNPHLVSATANPPYGGTIEGVGMYLCDQLCNLTAVPTENFEFYYWKQNNEIVSYDSIFSLFTIDDVDNIEAVFSLKPIQNITTSTPNTDAVCLFWSNRNLHSWPLLKQFDIKYAQCIATDGKHLYTTKDGSSGYFFKYLMDGLYIKSIWTSPFYPPNALTCDGSLFYFINGQNLFCFDLANQNLISDIRTGSTPFCSYDYLRDGFWIAPYRQATYKLQLVDRTGALIQQGPSLPSKLAPNGSGFFVGEDQDSHLMIKTEDGHVFDYDIEQDVLCQTDFSLETSRGCYIGKNNGKDAIYVCYDNAVKIYEVSSKLWNVTKYRLYRSDDKGNVSLIADEITSNSYIDNTWSELETGLYRFGISSYYSNGNESNILWSDPIPKGNYGIEESVSTDKPTVQKTLENGQIVIIKNGKRYNIAGQELKK